MVMRPASRMTDPPLWSVVLTWIGRITMWATLLIGGNWMSREAFQTSHPFDVQNFCQGFVVFLVGYLCWITAFMARMDD